MGQVHPRIGFSVHTTRPLFDGTLAARILSVLRKEPPALAPTTFARYAPATRPLQSNEDAALAMLVAQRAQGSSRDAAPSSGTLELANDFGARYQLFWERTRDPVPASVCGSVPADFVDTESGRQRLRALVFRLFLAAESFYGEIRDMRTQGWDLPFDFSRRLPDPPWVVLLGPELRAFFTDERSRSAPVSFVHDLDDGASIALGLAQSPDQVTDDMRTAVRRHLGEDSFMSGGRWRYKNGRLPALDLSHYCLEEGGKRATHFALEPHRAVGPIRRGMSRDEVRRSMGQRAEPFFKSTESTCAADAFGDALHVYYDKEGKVSGAEVFPPSRLLFGTLSLIGGSAACLRSRLQRLGVAVEPSEGGLSVPELGVDLYVPAIDDDPRAEITSAYVSLVR